MMFLNQNPAFQSLFNPVTFQTPVYPTLLESNPVSTYELPLEKPQQHRFLLQNSHLTGYMNQPIPHLSPSQPEIRLPASNGGFPQNSSTMSSLSLSYPTASRPPQMQPSYSQPSQVQPHSQPQSQLPSQSQSQSQSQFQQQPAGIQSASSTPAYFSPSYSLHERPNTPGSANISDISTHIYFDGPSSHQAKMANQSHQLSSYSASSGLRSASMGRRNSPRAFSTRSSSSTRSRSRSRRASGARRRGSHASSRDLISEKPDRVYKSVNNQKQISPSCYMPADQMADIGGFTEEDIYILKSLLPLAESHKWKFLSSKLSRLQSRKFNAEFCARKFHEMYHLPFNQSNSLLKAVHSLKDKGHNEQGNTLVGVNYEGLIGSSLPYIICRDGWNYVD